jgi:hypothetical protein
MNLTARRYTMLMAALWLLAGCGVPGAVVLAPSAAVTADVFGAQQVGAAAGDTIEISKNLDGAISVVAYPPPLNEVALDYIVVGQGANHEAALQAARQQQQLIKIEPWADRRIRINASAANASNTVQLFVRVPEGSNVIISSTTGSVSIFGPVQNATARLDAGHIEARGATGNVTLETGRGNIQTALRSMAATTLVLNTAEGDITSFAVDARVTAKVARQGSIRFVGTLRDLSEFQAKGSGNVTVVLPESSGYFMRAVGGERVTVDYVADTEVCGMYNGSGGYRYETQPTGDRYGRVEVRSVVSGSVGLVEGTMGADYYFFTTDRPEVVIAPPPQNPVANIAAPARRAVGICAAEAGTTALPVPPVTVHLAAEKGLIVVHYIRMGPP